MIPFDDAVAAALDQGRIVAEASPDSAAAVQYHRLAEALKLADDALPLKKAAGPAALVAAAASLLEPVGASVRGSAFGGSPGAVLDVSEETADVEPPPDLDLPEPDLPTFSGLARITPPSLTLPAFRPPPAAVGKLETKPTGPEEQPVSRSSPKKPASGGMARLWLLGVGAAVAVGIGLRFIRLSDAMMPIAVGVAVTAAVILAMRVILTTSEAPAKPKPTLAAALPAKTPQKEIAATRLAALAHSSRSGSYRKPSRQ